MGKKDTELTIRRYTSTANTLKIFNRNHPMEFKALHAFSYNSKHGHCDRDLIDYNPVHIGNDVWIGHNAILLPKVSVIADGAVIGAGAVVHDSVPPYAVVAGSPARVVRYRFSKDIIEALLSTQWWASDIDKLKPIIDEYQNPYAEALQAQKK